MLRGCFELLFTTKESEASQSSLCIDNALDNRLVNQHVNQHSNAPNIWFPTAFTRNVRRLFGRLLQIFWCSWTWSKQQHRCHERRSLLKKCNQYLFINYLYVSDDFLAVVHSCKRPFYADFSSLYRVRPYLCLGLLLVDRISLDQMIVWVVLNLQSPAI